MRTLPNAFFVVGLVILLLAGWGSATAQGSTEPPGSTVSSEPAWAEITLPEDAPAVVSMTLQPDTLGFGEAGLLNLVFARDDYLPAASDLKSSAPWLQLADPAERTSARGVDFVFRAYQLQPFGIRLGTLESPLQVVTESPLDLNETAPIRMPRSWATRWWILVLAALLITLMLFGLWLLWGRRLRLNTLEQWDPAAPAWLTSAVELRLLLTDSVNENHDPHHFLDRLAKVTRRFLARRYLVAAEEMTGKEILAHCRLLGHDSPSLRRLVRIVDELDHNRYDPAIPTSSWCREKAGEVFQAMAEVRIEPRYTVVEAKILLQGRQAWAWLEETENLTTEPRPAVGRRV